MLHDEAEKRTRWPLCTNIMVHGTQLVEYVWQHVCLQDGLQIRYANFYRSPGQAEDLDKAFLDWIIQLSEWKDIQIVIFSQLYYIIVNFNALCYLDTKIFVLY